MNFATGKGMEGEMKRRMPIYSQGFRCNCYVQTLSAEDQFCLHYGAHDPKCPVYRVSFDPVDRKHDEDIRNLLKPART